MLRLRSALLLSLLLTPVAIPALAPATALANSPATVAPPGNSAISQYVEVVPSPVGGTPPRPPGQSGPALTPGGRHRLDRIGPDGRALAAIVDATTPAAAVGGEGWPGGTAAPVGPSAGTASAAGRVGSGRATTAPGSAVRGSGQAAGGSGRAASGQDPGGPSGVANGIGGGTAAALAGLAARSRRGAADLLVDAALGGSRGGLGILGLMLLVAGVVVVVVARRSRRTSS